MANTLLTIGMITKKALALFLNTNSFIKAIDKQYSKEFAVDGAKIGSSIKIRLPNDYTVRTGQTAVVQNTTELYTNLTVTEQAGVDVTFSSADLALSLDDFGERVLEPMMNDLSGYVANDVMGVVETIPNAVYNGSGGANIGNVISPVFQTWANAGALLDKVPAPRDKNRWIMMDPQTQANTVTSFSGFFNNQALVGEQYKTAEMPDMALGFNWAMDQTVYVHQTGTFANGTVNGTANQTGNTIGVTGTTGTLNVGDIVTFAGVFLVNRNTKASTGKLAQFVITAPVAAGATTISIYPAITPPVGGLNVAYQTVTASPAAGAGIYIVFPANSQYRKNFGFLKSAFTMATADLFLPTKAVLEAYRAAYNGISMRIVTDYITNTDQQITRSDILYGWAGIRPEWAVVVGDLL
jgi:hypothetical protein